MGRGDSDHAIANQPLMVHLPLSHSPSLRPSSPIVGFDLNPLAVLTARANYLIAIADLLPETPRRSADLSPRFDPRPWLNGRE